MSDEGYAFQTSIKHGRNGSVMTNVRGKNADEFGENLTIAKNEFVPLVQELVAELQAVDALAGEFQVDQAPAQQAPQQTRYGSGGRPSYGNGQQQQRQGGYQRGGGGGGQQGGGQQGAPCDHGVARKWVSGTSKRTGKAFSMWACVVEDDPNSPQCSPIFV